ncbi:MAG: hypothetical protein LBU27_01420 [Candidatus Peribacteria bacterium]|jgi:septin family protein|nr:hypothetical protein [Candidatus Peribacteria bacterium]
MTKISSNVEQQQSREAVKDFLAKELNNPELAKQTTEQIEKNPETMKQLQTIMEKNIKPIIEKGGTLPATPEGVKQAKMLIAYQILERKNINGYFPKKSDELINRASEVLKRLVNANNLDKKI